MDAVEASIRDRLHEGDRRETGSSETVAAMALSDFKVLGAVLECLDDTDPGVVSHAAHALMRVSEQRPELFVPSCDFLLERLARPKQWEIGEQLPKILVRMNLSDIQVETLVRTLERNITSEWSIVAACSLQAIVDLAMSGRIDAQRAKTHLDSALSSKRKALAARAHRLRARLAQATMS
ncbi:hypothetical protein AAFN47_02600 [Hoeflea sp. CAU 1731]